MIRIGLILLFLFIQLNNFAVNPTGNTPFLENKGQWEENYMWYLKLRWGQLFFHDDRVLVDTWDQKQYQDAMEAAHNRNNHFTDDGALLRKHAYEMVFPASSEEKIWTSLGPSDVSFNYYLGNDPGRWKTGLKAYETIQCKGLWEGVDMVYKTKNGLLKYEFYVNPGAGLKNIQIRYNGIDRIYKRGENIVVSTSCGDITELAPVAWQVIDGKKIFINCHYSLKNQTVSFALDKAYDSRWPLVIDPEIIFSSYTGSTGDNWGSTATYDDQGNAYLGGINFKTGYPVTIGAYQTNFAGDVDVTVTKFSPKGDKPIYNTYIGGSQTEIAYSMVVDGQGNLFVTGSTGSSNFPVSANAFGKVFRGGSPAFFWQNTATTYLANFPNGSDLFVSKLSPDGSKLLASSFLGGSSNEGLNLYGGLNHNYGDAFRGEVICDKSDNIYIIGSTMSSNLPVKNAWQNTFGGGLQDACLFKLSPDMSNLLFCSYFGGSGDDGGYGMSLSQDGYLYFCGGTKSAAITGNKKLQQSNNGDVDGYVARVNVSGGNGVDFTFLGSSFYDQCYFVQVDNNNDIIVLGQTEGNYPIVAEPGKSIYSVPNGTIFFHKLPSGLDQTIWSTRFGVSGTTNHLVPTAFLVDYCNYISFSIWGGVVNAPLYSTTIGLPITPDAFQSKTSGSDFYLGVLKDNASALHYGTFFGGDKAYEHVDGGTSRFDKNGIIYQAVCAGCGPPIDDMPVTPGVWSSTNNSDNCNAALFKFDLSEYSAIIEDLGPTALCVGRAIQFRSQSTGNPNLTWDFGDGSQIADKNPLHQYKTPGTYQVKLIARAQSTCITSDTAAIVVKIEPPPTLNATSVNPVCKGDTVRLSVSGAQKYNWISAPGISPGQSGIPNPLVRPDKTADYIVTGSGICGADTLLIPVKVVDYSIKISTEKTNICRGDTVVIKAGAAKTYLWNPSPLSQNYSGSDVKYVPAGSTQIRVNATDEYGCIASDSLKLNLTELPTAKGISDTTVCLGDEIKISGSYGPNDAWYLNGFLIGKGNISLKPINQSTLKIVSENQCGTDADSSVIKVSQVNAEIGPNKIVCALEPIQVFASGGKYYQWQPAADFQHPDSASTILNPKQDKIYKVTVSDAYGCSDVETLPVKTYISSGLDAGRDQFILFGEKTSLHAKVSGKGSLKWIADAFIECDTCADTRTYTEKSAIYKVRHTDLNGCISEDSLRIDVEGAIYLPNSFSPNNDGVNEIFGAIFVDILDYHLEIFNRWGELIFTGTNAIAGWDGTLDKRKAQSDIYAYKLKYTLNSGRKGNATGWVLLLN